MRSLLICLFLVLSFFGSSQQYKDGDLIFQHSASTQSKAVQLATQSYYSHCGIIFYMDGNPYVFEAVEPVGVRSLADWIKSGENQNYAVYRLKNNELYCSELAFKAYRTIGIELCRPKALRDFNLESPQVRKLMQQRYGDQIPYDEPMVSPGQLTESALLYKVH
jgi:hypothetical protein